MASTSAEQGRQVATRAAGEGQRVASRAREESQAVARTARDQGQAVARTARSQSRSVARLATGSAREIRGTVKEQAAQVRDELTLQGRTVAHEARSKLEEETGVQARRAADGLTRLAAEVRALAEGRPEEAATVREYVATGAERLLEAADRVAGLAEEVEMKGIDGLVDDVKRFARRRPGTFLLGAAIAGFGVGRIVRAGAEDGGEEPVDEPVRHSPARHRAVSNGRRALPEAGAATASRARAAR